jgi:sugar lactone lactonase YvrE
MHIALLAAALLAQPASPDLSAIVADGAKAELVAEGFTFTEGPVWSPEGFLLFSDIPEDKIYKWMPGMEKPVIFREPSGFSNGLAFDDKGRLLAAEHVGRVTRTGEDGAATPIAEKFEGKGLSSPNDVVAGPGGSVYFTDPIYGLKPRLGPTVRERQTEFNGVYRIGPDGSVAAVVKDFTAPNGLAFSPDGKALYIADTAKGVIRAFEVGSDGTLSGDRVFADVKAENGRSAGPDGIKVSAAGHVLCAARGGVWVWDPAGKLLGRIEVPKGPTNLCFGGPDFKTLFITASPAVYKVELKVAGAK